MTTMQTRFSREELLRTYPVSEPQVAGGVLCHGGFDEDGNYVSPRTMNRVPAIEAWQEHHRELFATEIMQIPLATWPESYPNLAQARYLLSEGVRDPIASILTRIGTVEGFGALIRDADVPGIGRFFAEELTGTALEHLGTGLFEAHGMDEAGDEAEAGHKDMWYLARDIAFEHPFSEDQTAYILELLGVARPGSGGKIDFAHMRAQALANRIWPSDIDFTLESVAARMARILLIEIQAYHTFRWAEDLLSDTELVAGDGTAAELVSHIRQDEGPHVGYLRTALTEMRDRTFVGESGQHHAGSELIAALMDRSLEQSLGVGRLQGIAFSRNEVRRSLEGHRRGSEILERFDDLGSVRPDRSGRWMSTETGESLAGQDPVSAPAGSGY